MILPLFNAHMLAEEWRRQNEQRKWPEVVMLDSSGERVTIQHVTFDPVLNQIVLVKE